MTSTAPCDWLADLRADLDTFHPDSVVVATSGNSATRCMRDPATRRLWPVGSVGYYERYRADLDAIFSRATAAGAKVVFVEDPRFLAPARDAAVIAIIAIATRLAHTYHGVSMVDAARRALSDDGRYVEYKPCLKHETAAMGCVHGRIAIRTLFGFQKGLHLCPPGLVDPVGCPVYSSGEERFGAVIARVATRPPKPVLR